MISPDYKAFDNLVKSYMLSYGHMTKSTKTGWDLIKDDYGDNLALVPFIDVVLKDDADMIAEAGEHKAIRVSRKH